MAKWFPHILLIAGPFAVSGCDVNTALGWPSDGWGDNFFFVVGFLFAIAMLAGAVRLAFVTSNKTSRSHEAIAGIVSMLLSASVLLQLLPAADAGLQLIPLAPWSYVGWFSTVLSVIVWLVLLIAIFAASSESPDSATSFSALLLLAMSGNALLSFSEQNSPSLQSGVANQSMVTKSTEDEVESWKARSVELRQLLNELAEERHRLSASITQLSDSRSYRSAKAELVAERTELFQQIESIETELAVIESAVVRAESLRRRLARHLVLNEITDATDSEFASMATIQRELQEQLRSLHSRSGSFDIAELSSKKGETQ